MRKRMERLLRWDVLVAVAAVTASALLAVSLGQDNSWDQRNYHYYAGYAALHKPPHYDFAPAQVQSFFNPLFHIPIYLMLRHLPAFWTALLLGALQGVNAWLVYLITRKMLGRLPDPARTVLSLACAITGYYGAVNLSEVGTTFGDNLISIPMLASIHMLLKNLCDADRPRRSRHLSTAGAGLICGIAVGLKLTTAIYALPLAAALLLITLMDRRPLSEPALLLAGMSVGFVLTYGAWGVSLYREYANPFFPYFNQIFRSEYYEAENPMDPRFLPRDASQRLFYPFYIARLNTLVGETRFRDIRLAACYLLVLALIAYALMRAVRKDRRSASEESLASVEVRPLLFLSAFIVLSYVLWQELFSIYRYAVTLEMLAPVFISSALLLLGRRIRGITAIALAANLSVCLYVVPLGFGRQQFNDQYLKVQPPAWPDLDKCVVLMGGDEASAYIIPSFPPTTRFVRLQANFIYPGRNINLDRKIRTILSRYGSDRTLFYLHSREELEMILPALAYFGIEADGTGCEPIRASWGEAGFLCPAERGAPGVADVAPTAARPEAPDFVSRPEVRLEVTPQEAQRGKDTLHLRLSGMKARALDLLYTLDGEAMEPVRKWFLDDDLTAEVFVSVTTRPGLYHFIGIRDSDDAVSSRWIRIDVAVRVR